ncbi:uncharacterized protein M421DRAFT_5606 [Didymella exigua CBS 183.55]|uniref:Uncharacterized protein n=1 Tax=Didymella exigua CBS 183.55 TaxID=1150837 RepID=A0A6A5RL12_9PLEO|nr:uncharacterized protein M421DRAFT_5606 [Didymella exigua CBS 183.55]KAF1927940.1 hypothetical protein M421DRAFT_5606 [Didymella exigua CBS 183.55]
MSTLKDRQLPSDCEKRHSSSPEADDVALGVFEDLSDSDGAVNDTKLLRKIDMRLMPLPQVLPPCVTYMLQSIDKTTLSYAAVFDLREDTNLVGKEYSWLGSLFYLGYPF